MIYPGKHKGEKEKHKYLSDLKDVFAPPKGPAFQFYEILLILRMGSVSVSVKQQGWCLCLMSFNGPQRLFAQLFTGFLSAIIIPEPLYGAEVAGCA